MRPVCKAPGTSKAHIKWELWSCVPTPQFLRKKKTWFHIITLTDTSILLWNSRFFCVESWPCQGRVKVKWRGHRPGGAGPTKSHPGFPLLSGYHPWTWAWMLQRTSTPGESLKPRARVVLNTPKTLALKFLKKENWETVNSPHQYPLSHLLISLNKHNFTGN